MISKNISIIRNFTVELQSTNNKFCANGYIESNKELTKHEIHVWWLEKEGEEYHFPFQEDEDGSWCVGYLNNRKGKDITDKKLLDFLAKEIE